MPDKRDTEEYRWFDPDWDCPRCRSVNMGIREICRICGLDSARISEGVLIDAAN